MVRKVVTSMLLILVAVVWTACAGSGAPAQPMPMVQPQADVESPRATGNEAGSPAQDDRMVIKRAELGLVVKEAEATATAIRDLVGRLGGYVSNSSLYRDGSQLRGTMEVRVPAGQIDETLTQIKALGIRVLRDNLSSEDVTQEFTDLGSRLRNLEATETELLAMLTEVRQRPNAKTDDILQVYNQLAEIRGQIEQIKGRMQYLGNLTALATISIELVPDEAEQPVIEEGWQPLATLRSAAGRLVSTLQGLIDLVIWLAIYVLPTLIILALPIILIIYLIRRARRGTSKPASSSGPPPAAPTEEPPAPPATPTEEPPTPPAA